MHVERGRRNGITAPRMLTEGLMDGMSFHAGEINGFGGGSRALSTPSSSRSPSPSPTGVSSSIEHRVSKMDTLAGIAIKYGVEVADIKRMNGLVTDLQMFAHKKLQIPLPGRHPPSPNLPNVSSINGEETARHKHHCDVLDSFQSLKLKPPRQRVSAAMNSLQGYYGLTPPRKGTSAEGTEMAVYRTKSLLDLDDSPLPRVLPVSESPPSQHYKSRNFVNGFSPENGEDTNAAEAVDNDEAERSHSEKFVRRRQKADADSLGGTPELSKADSGGSASGRNGMGLALRPKSGSRTDLDSACKIPIPLTDSFLANGFISVRKSSSTPNFEDSMDSSSLWPSTKWTIKADAISRPILDGLQMPIGFRKNKAALD